MNDKTPGFWPTVWLLVKAARRRDGGRRHRQQQLLNQRTGKQSASRMGLLATGFAVVFMLLIHGLAAMTLFFSVLAGERTSVERSGKIVVSQSFYNMLLKQELRNFRDGRSREKTDDAASFAEEGRRIASDYGETKEEATDRLRQEYLLHGANNLTTEHLARMGFRQFAQPRWGHLPAMRGSIVLIWWAIMLIFQGEGLELDLQRRRHPMWEWLFSHPVPIGAVFLAEMLSPLAANPIYCTAPFFVGIAYGLIYGVPLGLLAAVLIGIPFALVMACTGKALENTVMLRVAPRQRGAVLGLMGWLGYASMMLLLVGTVAIPKLAMLAMHALSPLARLPWPWLGLFLGSTAGGSFSFSFGVLTCEIALALLLSASVWLNVWGAQRGLAGTFGARDARPATIGRPANFGSEPLYRKEMLWFVRDRSAIVQAILIPLSVAGMQLFNLRGVLRLAQGDWNYLCGAAIIFGTYFLWILGPKSLASEGSALWIALTWPRGLESLLKAKAWLWSMISTALVALVLVYALVLFPHQAWKIALVGLAWVLFGRSMAEKAVTLVTVTSESGEVQRLRGGSRIGAQLGMLTFATGILTQQWNIAIMGIVYSYMTAAAMWQNFRERLPFLYDPWSEVLPDPPTLVQSMVAISVMVELGAVLTGILIAIFGRTNAHVAQAAAYGASAILVFFGTIRFLDNRGVSTGDIWVWQASPHKPSPKNTFAKPIYSLQYTDNTDDQPEILPWWKVVIPRDRRSFTTLLAAGGIGLLLGFVSWGYAAILAHLPWMAEMLRKAQEAKANSPHWRIPYAVMAVGFAPFAEEYLFRGLLFRALDREWGGWKAVAGSAAFFAIYHPVIAWPMVFTLGAVNALLFRKSRLLSPAVLLHMLYNAVVLWHA